MHFATILKHITDVEVSVQPRRPSQGLLWIPVPELWAGDSAGARHAGQSGLCLPLTPGRMFTVSVP